MKRLAIALCLFAVPALATADALALKVGASAWMADGKAPGFNSGDEEQLSLAAAFEHPIPLIPNIKLRYWDYSERDGLARLELTTLDTIAYYEILDNPAIDIDLGVAATFYQDGRAPIGRKFDDWLPQGYAAARIPLVGFGLNFYAEATATNWDSTTAYDIAGGLEYLIDMPVLDVGLRLGYRQVDNDFDDFDNYSGDVEFSGWSLGLLVDL